MRKKRQKAERAAAAVPAREFALPWWTPLAVLTALIAVYSPALHGPPLFDDVLLPVFQPHGPHAWLSYFRGGRPLYYLSLQLNYVLTGQDPFWYHLTNVLLHALVGWLVYFILRRALELTGSARREASLAALFGSLVFLFHPVQTEAVAYIASRSESLSTLFAYAALALLLAQSEEAIGWGRAVLILGLLAAGTLVKEHVVAMAAVLPLVDWRLKQKGSLAGLARNWRLHAALLVGAVLAVPAIVLFVTRHSSHSAGLAVPGTTWFRYLCTQFEVIWIYIRLFLLPIHQSLSYDVPTAGGLFEPLVLLGLAGLVGLLYLAWRTRSRYPLAALGIVVFLILLAPTSSVIPIADTAAERRMYLPFIGLVLVVAECVRRIRPAARKNALLCGVIVALGVGTWRYSHAFSSAVSVWEHAAAAMPENLRARTYLGAAYIQAGRCADAVTTFERIQFDAQHGGRLGEYAFLFYMNFAAALECQVQFDRAEQVYHKAIEAAATLPGSTRIGRLAPQARAWARLAHLYVLEQNWDQAFAAQKQAAQLDPGYGWMAYSIRGSMELSLNRYEEAAAAFQQALQLHPGDAESKQGLATANEGVRARQQSGIFLPK
jgi:tetratricopeptide (TPR) repeat protein